MKKIFILPILILPIAATAADPIGPAHVNSGAVVATASAPYETATEQTGDSTTVVSASYVKGAYNDAISAINNVASKVSDVEDNLSSLSDFVNGDIEDEIAEKQDKLIVRETDTEMTNEVMGSSEFDDLMRDIAYNGLNSSDFLAGALVNADGIAAGIMAALSLKGVKAVTTWGSNTETTLGFVPKL